MVDIFLGYDFKEWSEIIRNLVLCAVAIFTAWVASKGLNAWKNQQDRELAIKFFTAHAELKQELSMALSRLEMRDRFLVLPDEKSEDSINANWFRDSIVERLDSQASERADELRTVSRNYLHHSETVRLLWNDERINSASTDFLKTANLISLRLETATLNELAGSLETDLGDFGKAFLSVISDLHQENASLAEDLSDKSSVLVSEINRKTSEISNKGMIVHVKSLFRRSS